MITRPSATKKSSFSFLPLSLGVNCPPFQLPVIWPKTTQPVLEIVDMHLMIHPLHAYSLLASLLPLVFLSMGICALHIMGVASWHSASGGQGRGKGLATQAPY